MRVDSHVHFWHYDQEEYDWISDGMEVLQQDYLPQYLSRTLKRNGLDACVAVQARQSELETHFLVELSKTHDFINGVVGWIDLRDEKIVDRLQYFSQYPIIKGWRHVLQGEADDFALQKDFLRGIKALQPYGYTYDVLIYHHQLRSALEFVSKFPEQKFVIDHCAKPDIRKKNINEWKSLMQEMAKLPNVSCKVSGLLTETRWKQWSAADFYPYFDVLFEAFGTDRLLFGSDWPVMLLSGIYVQWRSLLDKYMENLDEEEKEKVMGANAVSFYRLDVI
ncbi:MAG: amidohydrolase family protein [Chitinophagaceae bacterium]